MYHGEECSAHQNLGFLLLSSANWHLTSAILFAVEWKNLSSSQGKADKSDVSYFQTYHCKFSHSFYHIFANKLVNIEILVKEVKPPGWWQAESPHRMTMFLEDCMEQRSCGDSPYTVTWKRNQQDCDKPFRFWGYLFQQPALLPINNTDSLHFSCSKLLSYFVHAIPNSKLLSPYLTPISAYKFLVSSRPN